MVRPRSFFSSLLIGNLLLIAGILAAGAWWTFREMDRQASWHSRRFQDQLLILAKEGLEENWHNAAKVIEQYCRSYANQSMFRLTVINADGQVLGDSEVKAATMDLHNTESHPEFRNALSGQVSESLRLSHTNKIRYRYAAAPILYEKSVVGAVRIAIPVSDLAEDRRRLLSGIATCFALMLLAACLFATFFSWLWSKPLKTISQAARQIAEGDLHPIPDISGPMEMIELHNAVERMRRAAETQLNSMTWQWERLRSVLEHLPDAVFALDSQDKVVYYNKAALLLFQLESFSVPLSVQHVLRVPALLDYYFDRRETLLKKEPRNALQTDNTNSETLEIMVDRKKRVLEVELIDAFDHQNDDVAALLVIRDWTDAVRTEQMKTDFVANTSHELRTPLTAIRMTLDNALDGLYPDHLPKNAFEMLNRSVHRLEALTEDLLALHSAEEISDTRISEHTSLETQKSWIEEMFQSLAREKGITLLLDLPDNASTLFSVDTKRFTLVLQNLIDNALKFTKSGGEVKLELSFLDENTLCFQCRDSGVGISPEDQGRVFERFYRVKRNKSEQQPGTGLGLSIVKHAVERLGGSLSLSSQLGVGSTFTVRIPITTATTPET